MHLRVKAGAYFFKVNMVEFNRYQIEEQQSVHVETIEVSRQRAHRYFLNEDVTILLACNANDSAGQLQFINGIEHILDLGLCYRDPSTGDLVKVDDLDPAAPQGFSKNDIIRLRYVSDGVIEEARFVHKSSIGNENFSQKAWTTPRMRKEMQQELKHH